MSTAEPVEIDDFSITHASGNDYNFTVKMKKKSGFGGGQSDTAALTLYIKDTYNNQANMTFNTTHECIDDVPPTITDVSHQHH